MEQDLKKIAQYFHGLEVTSVAECLQTHIAAEGDKLELEFRIGETVLSRGRSTFNSHLSEMAYLRILDRLSKGKGMHKAETKKSECICFESTKTRCENGIWSSKSKLVEFTSANQKGQPGPDVRIAMSRELIFPAPSTNPSGKRVIRIKERTSFTYKMWRFDLTKVTQDGTTKYEAEIELVTSPDIISKLSSDTRYAVYIVTYGLLLACDLVEMARS